MLDVAYVALMVAFFALCVGFVRLCDRIIGPEEIESSVTESTTEDEAVAA
jgi:hypothetical protein